MRLPWKTTPRALSPTPSLSYKPATKQDKKADKQLAAMHQHREKTGTLHPDVPLYPSGRRPMSGEEAAATRIFKDRYQALGLEAAEAGVADVFRNREYGQTFRRDGGDMVANQQHLRVGERTSIGPEPGMFPPNTRMEIHSHPDIALPLNAIPSDLDHRSAHQQRTNALHRPGTEISGALLYYPPTDTFLSYTGALTGPRNAPEFQELFDPFPPSRLSTGSMPLSRLPIPDAPSNFQGRDKPLPPLPPGAPPTRAPASGPVPGSAPSGARPSSPTASEASSLRAEPDHG